MKQLFFLPVLLLLISCGKDDGLKDSDTLIFGHFFGECFGERCVEIFKIENDRLYEDTNDQYPSINGNTYNWEIREDIDVVEIENILKDVPADLFNETEQIIGMPDAGDWGGIYVKVIREDETFFWLIDHADENIPSYLVDFTMSIKNSIEALK